MYKTALKSAGIVILSTFALLLTLFSLHIGGWKALSVQTGSMRPAINPGDMVLVKSVPIKDLRIGDVITYISPTNKKQTITHRIVQKLGNINGPKTFIVKGDANNKADSPVSQNDIIGKVTRKIPVLGHLIDITRSPVGLFLLIYIPAMFVIAEELRRLTRYYKQQQPYVVAGREPRKTSSVAGTKIFSFVLVSLVVVITIAHSALAALQTQATLTGNRITANGNQTTANHILFRRVEFECSSDNNNLVSKLLTIIMYNPAAADTNTGNWYILSSQGRLVTFVPKTVFDSKDNYDIEPDLQDGLKYSGDFLALFDQNNHLVDAISWGTDTTYLHPSLPGVSDGTQFRRVDLLTDTDTAVDWSVSVSPCTID